MTFEEATELFTDPVASDGIDDIDGIGIVGAHLTPYKEDRANADGHEDHDGHD